MVQPVEGDTEVVFKDYQDSLNLDKVIRSIELEDGRRLVLLDDLHERVQQKQMTNAKGIVTGIKREKDAMQSEIYLEPEDAARFVEVTK